MRDINASYNMVPLTYSFNTAHLPIYTIPDLMVIRLFWLIYKNKAGGYHGEQLSQFITLKSQIFPVQNSNLQSSASVAKSSACKIWKFLSFLSPHLWFSVSYNLLSSQRLIFRLPENLVTPKASQSFGLVYPMSMIRAHEYYFGACIE